MEAPAPEDTMEDLDLDFDEAPEGESPVEEDSAPDELDLSDIELSMASETESESETETGEDDLDLDLDLDLDMDSGQKTDPGLTRRRRGFGRTRFFRF